MIVKEIVTVLSLFWVPSFVASKMIDGYDVIDPVVSDLSIIDHEEVFYSCTFTSLWTKKRQPDKYPADAKWITPMILSHDDKINFWSPGEIMTPGMEIYVETGGANPLIIETILLGADTDSNLHTGKSVMPADGSGDSIKQTMSKLKMNAMSNNIYVSSITKMFPTSDWFSGFYNYNVVHETTQKWMLSFRLETYPYDGGSEKDDKPYLMSNDPEPQFKPISILSILPVAQWDCMLLKDELGVPSSSPSTSTSNIPTTLPSVEIIESSIPTIIQSKVPSESSNTQEEELIQQRKELIQEELTVLEELLQEENLAEQEEEDELNSVNDSNKNVAVAVISQATNDKDYISAAVAANTISSHCYYQSTIIGIMVFLKFLL